MTNDPQTRPEKAPTEEPVPERDHTHSDEITRLSRHDRIVRCTAYGVLGIFLVFGLVWFSLAWRLTRGPIDADFALPLIESALSRGDVVKFDIGGLTLEWNRDVKQVEFKLRNMTVIGSQGPFLIIRQADLGLSFARLFIARLNFPDARISGLALRIMRMPDGSISLTGEGQEQQVDPDLKPAPLTLQKIVNGLPSVARLRMNDMAVIFEDRKEGSVQRFRNVDAEVDQSHDFAGRDISGFVTMDIAGGEHDGAHVALDFIYESGDGELTAIGRLEKGDTRKLVGSLLESADLPMIEMNVDAEAEARLRNDFSLKSLAFRMKGEDGTLVWPESYGPDMHTQKVDAMEAGMSGP